MLKKLNFGLGNAKLSKAIATFSLPAGHTCPFAKQCLSRSNRFTGKISDGKHCRFRCFAATTEARATSVRIARWNNYEALQLAGDIKSMGIVIQNSLPYGLNLVRNHVSGDYYNEKYFLAWLNVALNNPHIIFYGYTKALPFLVKYKKHIPENFRFTASKGGTHDHLITKHNLRFAEVVFSINEAKDKGLEIDHDDSLAIASDKSFGLLLHGSQKSNTPAAEALKELKKNGWNGYNENTKLQVHNSKSFNVYVDFKEISSLNIKRGHFFTQRNKLGLV